MVTLVKIKFWPGNQATKCLHCFSALLASAIYSAGWSGWEWQPAADWYGRLLAHFYTIWSKINGYYTLQLAAAPNTASSNFKKVYIYWIFIHGIHYSQYHYIKLFHHFQTFLYNLTIKKLVPFFIRQFHIILHYNSFRCRQLTSGSSLLRCTAHEKRHIILHGNKILIPSRNKIIIIPSIPTVQCSFFSWKVS